MKFEKYISKNIDNLSVTERSELREWLDNDARMIYPPYEYNCLLGWFVLGDISIPLSPKEAGFDE